MHVREKHSPPPSIVLDHLISRLSDSVFRTPSLPNPSPPRVAPRLANVACGSSLPPPYDDINGATFARLATFPFADMSDDTLSAFPAGESSSGRRRSLRPQLCPPTATEELSNFDAMFYGVSLRSLLQDKPISSSPSLFSSSFSSSSSSSPHWPPLPSPVSRCPPSPGPPQPLPFHYSPSPLKMPKQEPRHSFPELALASSPFNSLSVADDSTICFPLHRLPDLLHSLETLQPEPTQPAGAGPSPARKRPADPERTKRAKEKRKKINQCLKQLHELVMPRAERKMDTLTTLEEACKQVAYLQQLVKSALQRVPHESPPPTPCFSPYCPTEDDFGGGGSGGDGMLGRLRMQHLLERMENSLPAQAMLINQEYGVAAATTNQQWQLLKQQLEEEAASEMRMEMQQQMWLNLEAPPNQSPL